MKKSVIAIVGVIVIVAVVLGIVLMNNSKDTSSDTKDSKTASSKTTTASSSKFTKVDACSVLTPAVAQQLTGADATTTPVPETSTSSVSVTNCSYYSSSAKLSVSLLSRSALDQAGADTNKGQFSTGLPSGTQSVSGYGDAAYWSPTYGQFNILKHNNWYILSFGGTNPTTHTLDDGKKLADLIIDKL